MIAGLARAGCGSDPDNHEGWFLLGLAYRDIGALRRGRPGLPPGDGAGAAQCRLHRLSRRDAAARRPTAPPPPEAERLFRRALELQPGNPQARYYLATIRDMRGDHRGAVDDLIALLREAPAGAPWEPQVREAATAIARANNIDIAGRLPAAPRRAGAVRPRPPPFPARPPSRWRAASAMPPSQQDEMVPRHGRPARRAPAPESARRRRLDHADALAHGAAASPRAAREALRSGLAALPTTPPPRAASARRRASSACRRADADWSPGQLATVRGAAAARLSRSRRARRGDARARSLSAAGRGSREIDALRAALAEAQAGRAFLLQGGDCAESFAEFSPENIAGNVALIEAMAERLGGGVGAAGGPDRADGRASSPSRARRRSRAGRHRPPRLSRRHRQRHRASTPRRAGPIPSGCSAPMPRRRRRSPICARRAPLHQPRGAAPALRAGAGPPRRRAGASTRAPPISSGSASAPPSQARPMSSSSRGLANPIGIKCGPDLAPETLLRLLDRIDPDGEPGRITLIARMGAARIADSAAAAARRGGGVGPAGALGLRSDARQHLAHRRAAPRPGRSS